MDSWLVLELLDKLVLFQQGPASLLQGVAIHSSSPFLRPLQGLAWLQQHGQRRELSLFSVTKGFAANLRSATA